MEGNGHIPVLGPQQIQVGVVMLLKGDPQGGPLEVVNADQLVAMIREAVAAELDKREEKASGLHHLEADAPRG